MKAHVTSIVESGYSLNDRLHDSFDYRLHRELNAVEVEAGLIANRTSITITADEEGLRKATIIYYTIQ